MTDHETVPGETAPKKKKKKRLGPLGYLRAIVIARTAAVSWPEAKEMARTNDLDPAGPTDIPTDSERRRRSEDGP